MDGIRLNLEDVPGALVVVEDGQVIAWNTSAERLLGLSDTSADRLSRALGWSPELALRFADALTNSPSPPVELAADCRAASGAPLVATVNPLQGAPGRWLVHLDAMASDGPARLQLERRLHFERLLTRAAASLIRSSDEELDRAVESLLGAVGGFFGLDRAYVFLIDTDRGIQSNTHEWVADGISHESQNLQELPLDTFPWLLSELRADRVVRIESLDELPEGASRERREFEREGIQSILLVPLWIGASLQGFVGFDAVRSRIRWDDPFVVGLRLMAQVLASALDARELSRRLKALALHDALTGLPNRTLLQDRFEQTSRRVHHDGEHVLLAVVDVDDFKLVNDRYGHPAGDALLCELGRRLRGVLRDTDTVARIGGDEFVILADGAAPGDLRRLAQRLLSTVEASFEIDGVGVRVGLSIGLAREQDAAELDLEALLRHADAAMYSAKSSGKNRWSEATGDGPQGGTIVAPAHGD